ncbi:Similar to Protein phosphatase 2C homolog 2; acc. no. Q09172 [Pyronema omphalodes CBS 100304]|uniref:Protein phosphatase 2C homolog 2 n=1 Tax=Pyronema omphalodes (strain CBS 100304) TaxID=1076935 RepID=U4LW16_PYROM|nr:Similar to Protein phosphatase 2C homolog 2; acc. no. Q09172 [Pyronema omphalodes CBS 100304]
MGQTLSEPVVEKLSESGGDDRLIYGLSSMQGWRISMEDAHAAILDLQNGDKEPKPTTRNERLSFFGVYDGHGGDKVAIFSGENVHKILAKQSAFAAGNFEQALKDGFLATDQAIRDDKRYEDEVSGCTASTALIAGKTIYVANAGDSRTVLGVKGRAKPLSFDHKPQNEGEKARITAAGGFVDFGRVNGNLALSRAIGDFEFKNIQLPPEQQIVTAYPDVVVHEISEDDEFLVVACDGIWDCQSSQAVVEFVRRGIAAKQPLEKICENMMDNCLASNSETGGVGCDNMTMLIVGFLAEGQTKEQWYDVIAKRVAEGDGPSEFRGPGKRGQFREQTPDEFDEDSSNGGSVYAAGGRGRVIQLGNGNQVVIHSEMEMFDDEQMKEDQDDEALPKTTKAAPPAQADSEMTDVTKPEPTTAAPAEKTDDKSTA